MNTILSLFVKSILKVNRIISRCTKSKSYLLIQVSWLICGIIGWTLYIRQKYIYMNMDIIQSQNKSLALHLKKQIFSGYFFQIQCMAQLIRVSAPDLRHAERPKFEPRPRPDILIGIVYLLACTEYLLYRFDILFSLFQPRSTSNT